jgi:hypothetical protein
MRLLGVVAYSNDLRTEVLEFFVRVPKLARLRSASFREVFGIEVYNYILVSTEIFEANVLAIASLQPESRSEAT